MNDKFRNYLDSITDNDVRELVRKNSFVTGGAIASLLLNEKVNDYDIYFTNKDTVREVCNYYISKFKEKNPFFNNIELSSEEEGRIKIVVKSSGVAKDDKISDEEKELYIPSFLSTNAITLTNKVQLITRFYGSPEDIHSNFDFLHCTCYWTPTDNSVVTSTEALECLLARELKYVGSKYPLASIIRSRKFLGRGFTIDAGQYLKMCLQLNDLDLTKLSVLEEQLTGVDAAYFSQMLACIKNEHITEGRVDNTYLMQLINRFF